MNSTDTKPWRISLLALQTSSHSQPWGERQRLLQGTPVKPAGAAMGCVWKRSEGHMFKNKINWKVSEPPANTAYSRTVFAVFFGVSVKVPQIGRNPRRLMPGSPEIAAGCLLCIVLGELRHAEKIYRPPHRAVSFRAFHRLVVQQSRPVASTTRIHLLRL